MEDKKVALCILQIFSVEDASKYNQKGYGVIYAKELYTEMKLYMRKVIYKEEFYKEKRVTHRETLYTERIYTQRGPYTERIYTQEPYTRNSYIQKGNPHREESNIKRSNAWKRVTSG